MYHLMAFKILYLTVYMLFLKEVFQFVILCSDIFNTCPKIWSSFPKLQTFSEIFWALYIDYSQYEKTILGIFICLFTKLQRQK